jgi:formylmethanofuran dehydrogenase subunit C
MAVDTIIPLAKDAWTELTAGDSNTITIVHRSGGQVIIQATIGASPAQENRDGLPLLTSENKDLAVFIKQDIDKLSHVANVNRVWAIAIVEDSTVYVQADG